MTKLNSEVLWVMDSVGYQEYVDAPTPHLDRLGKARRAMAIATYTVPSVHAMLRGILPQPCRDYLPYHETYSLISEHTVIPVTLARHGYKTILLTGNSLIAKDQLWLTKTDAPIPRQCTAYTPYFQHEVQALNVPHSHCIATALTRWIAMLHEEHGPATPFYAFILTTDTHTPYMNRPGNHRADQLEAITHTDHAIHTLTPHLPPGTRLIVTSDHAEAWHPDNTHHTGHNPRHYYTHTLSTHLHRRLLEVPLLEVKL